MSPTISYPVTVIILEGSSVYFLPRLRNAPWLYAVDHELTLESPWELLGSTDIRLKGVSRTGSVSIFARITVQDENPVPVPQAVVAAEWTLPAGATVNGRAAPTGEAAWLRIIGEGGFYTITLTDMTKDGYMFDPDNSVLSQTIAWF